MLRQLIERFRESKRNLHIVFIDLEKTYDKVTREVLWWTLIKDMYDGVVANVRTSRGITNDFSITIGFY